MPIMNNLNFAKAETHVQRNPFVTAKNNLLNNLQHQLKSAEAMIAGEVYMVEKMRTVTENGEKLRKLVKRPMRHWYWRDSTGVVRFAVRVSNKRIELVKGKADVVVGKDTDLPSIIEQLIKAVEAGELDVEIEGVVNARNMK